MSPRILLGPAFAAAMVGALLLAPRASAQGVGLEVSRVALSGLTIESVRAPADPALPVRLVIRGANEREDPTLVDVLVASNASDARTALEGMSRSISLNTTTAVPSLGDVAWARGSAIGFVRDQVAVVVRASESVVDPVALARAFDEAIVQTTRAVSVQPPTVATLSADAEASMTITRPVGAAAMDVFVDGPARVWRRGEHVTVIRTGVGRVVVRGVLVTTTLAVIAF